MAHLCMSAPRTIRRQPALNDWTGHTPAQAVYNEIHGEQPAQTASASVAPSSNIHIPNAYASDQSSEYPAKTEHSYWQPPVHPEEHSSQVSANPYTPSWMPHIDADWIHDTFSMPHAEAATFRGLRIRSLRVTPTMSREMNLRSWRIRSRAEVNAAQPI